MTGRTSYSGHCDGKLMNGKDQNKGGTAGGGGEKGGGVEEEGRGGEAAGAGK